MYEGLLKIHQYTRAKFLTKIGENYFKNDQQYFLRIVNIQTNKQTTSQITRKFKTSLRSCIELTMYDFHDSTDIFVNPLF